MATYAHDRLILCGANDGTLGYSKGNKYIPLYGRVQCSSDVTPVTVKRVRVFEDGVRIRLLVAPVDMELTSKERNTYKKVHTMENVLFKYEKNEDGLEAVYVQEEWKLGLCVRLLFANALRGRGAMLASNKDRVYVLDSSIPHEHQAVRRGYLKVDGSDKVEHFLQGMRWASRCEGFLAMRTESGKRVETFVILDCTRQPTTTAYYVVCTNGRGPNTLICKLEPIGQALESVRKVAWLKGNTMLGCWFHRVHTRQSFLFD